MRKVETRTTLRNQAGVIEFAHSIFPGFAGCRHLSKRKAFHENQNSLRAKPNRLSARWRARTALYSWLFARNHGGEFVRVLKTPILSVPRRKLSKPLWWHELAEPGVG